MISMAPGQQARLDDARHGVAGGLQASRRPPAPCDRPAGRAHEPQRDLERDAEQPFRSDEQPGEIGPACSRLSPPRRHDRAVGEHDAHAEHVIGGHAVAEAVRATGVERDVAADRADRLARRIGRVVEAVRRRHRGDGEVDDAGLDDRDARGGIEPQDPVEPVERDDDAVLDRDGAAGQAGAAAARHEGHAGRVAQRAPCRSTSSADSARRRARRRAERGEAVRSRRGPARPGASADDRVGCAARASSMSDATGYRE